MRHSFRHVERTSVSQPENRPAVIDVTVTEPTISADSTAEVAVTLTWRGADETVSFGRTAPITLPQRCRTPETGLLLFPTTRDANTRRGRPECWIPDIPPDDDFGVGLGAKQVALSAGDELTLTAAVWGDHRDADCLAPGVYSFRNGLGTGSEEPGVWEFELRLTDP
jgi:hypothetical protein